MFCLTNYRYIKPFNWSSTFQHGLKYKDIWIYGEFKAQLPRLSNEYTISCNLKSNHQHLFTFITDPNDSFNSCT